MDFRYLFEPRSIAIIGASTHPGNVGNDIVKNLVEQGYDGAVYPVNPKATELYGLPCYSSIDEVPAAEVDLAVIVIPAAHVAQALEQAAVGKRVRAAIVISAGFKEAGHIDLENALREVAERHDVALVGPNCLGVLNPATRMNASFAATLPATGSVAFLSQSGALCTAILDYSQSLGLGFSRFASIGNKALLDEVKFLEYLERDETTKVIGMYMEDLKDPKAFLSVARRMTHGPEAKPIVVIKSGRSDVGANAVASHTGSLAGSDASYDALFRQAGVIRVETIDELFGALQVLSMNPIVSGRRVAVITNAGGPGVLATDALVESGLELAKLSAGTQTALGAALPPAANTHNPIDVLGDALADRYAAALGATVADPGVDSLLVLLTPQSMTEIEATARAISEVKASTGKPIAVSFMGSALVRPGIDILLTHGIAAFRFPEEGAAALGILARYAEGVAVSAVESFRFDDIDMDAVRGIFDRAREEGKTQLPEADAVPVFAAYGFRTLASRVAKNADDVAKFASEFSSSFVMKIVSPDILHKSDVGGVRVGVENVAESASAAYEEMIRTVSAKVPDARIDGVLMVEMAPRGGAEMVLGSVKDPLFGHLAMVGLGGILVEVLKDVSFGLVSFDKTTARAMVDRLKGRKILAGVRGGAALDVDALTEALGRLSRLLEDFPEIRELDINPLLVLPEGEGTLLLDARVVLE